MLDGKELVPTFGLFVFADLRKVRTYEWSTATPVIQELEYLWHGLIEGDMHGKNSDAQGIWANVERALDWFHCTGAPKIKRQRLTDTLWSKCVTWSFGQAALNGYIVE